MTLHPATDVSAPHRFGMVLGSAILGTIGSVICALIYIAWQIAAPGG